MGASHRKYRKNIKSEQSYSCFLNSDTDTKLLLRKKLIEACSKGDCEEVENLLQLGVPVDSHFVFSDRFHYSVSSNQIYTLFALLPEQYREMSTLRTKKLKILDILFDYGVNVNQQSQDGKTVLHKLCTMACAEDFTLFKKIVEHDADIHIKDNAKNSLLHCCCYKERLFNKKSIIKFLLDKGLDPNCPNKDGDTAVHLSARCVNDVHIRLLTEHNALINIQNYTGHTPLHEAILHNKPTSTDIGLDATSCCNTIKTLLSSGADANIRDNRGVTPFGTALDNNLLRPYGGSELMDEFMSYGTDINAKGSSGNTVLHLCYKMYLPDGGTDRWQKCHHDIQRFVQLGANVNIKNLNNFCPIDYCIHFFKINRVQTDISFLLQAMKYHIEGGLNVNCLHTQSVQKLWELEIYNTSRVNDNTISKLEELFSLLKYFGYVSRGQDCVRETILPLKWMCANLIRTSLHPNAIVSVEQLSLPLSLQNYMLFQ